MPRRVNIVVISLADAHERRASMRAQLDRTGLEYHFLDAVDARDGVDGLFDGCDEARFLEATGRRPLPGEIACFASHVAVWRIVSASGRPVAVLEDDAALTERFARALAQCDRLIDGCGFIRLQNEGRARKSLVLRTDDGFSLYRYTKVPHSTAGYAISPAAAAQFCRHATVLASPVDIFLKQYWVHGQTMYGLVPYPVRDSPFSAVSQIGRRDAAGRTLVERGARVATRIGWFLRRIRAARKQRGLPGDF